MAAPLPAANTYLTSISSVATRFPQLVPQVIINTYPGLSFDVVEGNPLNPTAVADAQLAVREINLLPTATPQMKEYVALYEAAVLGQHTIRACNAGQNLNLGQLIQPTLAQQAQLARIEATLQQILLAQERSSARLVNIQLYGSNRLAGNHGSHITARYLEKEMPGDGTVLADAAFPNVQPIWTYPAAGQAVGTQPPFLTLLPNNPRKMMLQRAQLKALIIFYNKDMTMAAGDTQDDKNEKFRSFLVGDL